eukprot:TRINITY_DN14728_c0_g4_i1.p1 TRINITY_DN14728_c0_g4~~TRINITY_DN14728_c0_g4_i1.p1  ORF type:complete len:1144 (+),score=192.45 TRINITY_DN14728_c0_g4_i1:94-3525(+)
MSPIGGRYLAPLPAQRPSSSRPQSASKGTGSHVRSMLQLKSQPHIAQSESSEIGPGSGRTPASSSSAPELRPGSAPTTLRSPWNCQFRRWSLRSPKVAYANNATLQPARGRHPPAAQLPTRRRRALDSRCRLDQLCAPAALQLRHNFQNVKEAVFRELQRPKNGQTGVDIHIQGGDCDETAVPEILLLHGASPQLEQGQVPKIDVLGPTLSARGQKLSVRGCGGLVSPRPGPHVDATRHRKISRGVLSDDAKNVSNTGKDKASQPSTPGSAFSSRSSARGDPAKEQSSFDLEKMPKEKRWESAFQRMQQHGEIHSDSLVAGLELAGFARPRKAWIEETMQELTSYSTLDQDEFLRLLEMYEAKQLAHYTGIFQEFDEDDSGTLDEDELAKVLEHCGITALSQVIKEIVTEVAPLDPDSITIHEFKRLLEIIYTNEGFSKREVFRLREVFHKFDFSGDGALDIGELHKAIHWLGYAIPEQEIKTISDSVDVGGKGQLEEHEFIVCMRKVKEREIHRVKKAIKGPRLDNSNLERYLDKVLRALGYIPDPQAIRDCAEDAGILQAKPRSDTAGNARRVSGLAGGRRNSFGGGMGRRASFGAARRQSGAGDLLTRHLGTFGGVPAAGMLRGRTASCSSVGSLKLPGAENMTHSQLLQLIMPKPIGLSEVFLFLEVYRRREGMDRAQIMELESAFHKYDREGQGEMNVLDVGKVLRWLGYAVSFDVQQRLVKEVDVDQSGSLDIAEMRKLARIFREKELLSWTDTFKKRDKAKTGVMSVDACIHTLRAIGIQATPEEVQEIRDTRRPISAETHDSIRSSSSSAMSSSDSEDEPKKKHKKNKKKTCASKETLSSGMASDSSSDSESGSDSKSKTSESDDDRYRHMAPPKEGIDVMDFQLICSKLVAKAREAFRGNAGYTVKEVEKMRESFRKYDEDGSGDIDNQEIAKLMADLFPDAASDATRRGELTKILAEVDENGDGSLDFPDFLRLMRQFDDMQERSRIAKEELAMSKVQFTPAEVEDFRQLFLGKEQRDGSYRNALPFDQFSELIQKVVKLTRKQQEELYDMFSKVDAPTEGGSPKVLVSSTDQLKLKGQSTAASNALTVDFPEFLLLMDRLLATDFAGIRENSERIAESERQRQKQKRMTRKR